MCLKYNIETCVSLIGLISTIVLYSAVYRIYLLIYNEYSYIYATVGEKCVILSV